MSLQPEQTPSGNPPPGHFETHSLDGASWRSTPATRSFMTEDEMARAIETFRDDIQEEASGEPAPDKPTAQREYHLKRRSIVVEQKPWERVPTITVQERTPAL